MNNQIDNARIVSAVVDRSGKTDKLCVLEGETFEATFGKSAANILQVSAAPPNCGEKFYNLIPLSVASENVRFL